MKCIVCDEFDEEMLSCFITGQVIKDPWECPLNCPKRIDKEEDNE